MNVTPFRESRYLYLAVAGPLTKIGVSCQPEKRLCALARFALVQVRLLKIWDMPNGASRRVEAAVVRHFAKYRVVKREWFSGVKPESIIRFVEKHHE